MVRKTSAQQQDYSTLFGKIVLSKFDSMPEWARVCAFFISLLVMAYVTLHSLNAKYLVQGMVLEPNAKHTGNQAARGFDVRWAESYAGTDSKGHYVFALSPLEYAALLKNGDQTLQIWSPPGEGETQDQQLCQKAVSFDRLGNLFADYYIDGSCLATLQHGATDAIAFNRGLLPAVSAAVSSAAIPDYRILVRNLRFDQRWKRSDAAEMILFQGGEDYQLLNLPDNPYGKVSILPGGTFSFADGVYFPSKSLAGGRIRLSDNSGIFSYAEEWFNLPAGMEPGKPVPLNGDLGSQLTIVPLGRSIATVFRKSDDPHYYDALTQDLLKIGVLPVVSASPMGEDKGANTLFAGSEVLPSTVKSIVAAAVKDGIQLKRIAYPYSFKSTTDNSRIQLGWSKQCADAPAIPKEELDKLAGTADQQVQTFLQRFSNCLAHH